MAEPPAAAPGRFSDQRPSSPPAAQGLEQQRARGRRVAAAEGAPVLSHSGSPEAPRPLPPAGHGRGAATRERAFRTPRCLLDTFTGLLGGIPRDGDRAAGPPGPGGALGSPLAVPSLSRALPRPLCSPLRGVSAPAYLSHPQPWCRGPAGVPPPPRSSATPPPLVTPSPGAHLTPRSGHKTVPPPQPFCPDEAKTTPPCTGTPLPALPRARRAQMAARLLFTARAVAQASVALPETLFLAESRAENPQEPLGCSGHRLPLAWHPPLPTRELWSGRSAPQCCPGEGCRLGQSGRDVGGGAPVPSSRPLPAGLLSALVCCGAAAGGCLGGLVTGLAPVSRKARGSLRRGPCVAAGGRLRACVPPQPCCPRRGACGCPRPRSATVTRSPRSSPPRPRSAVHFRLTLRQ